MVPLGHVAWNRCGCVDSETNLVPARGTEAGTGAEGWGGVEGGHSQDWASRQSFFSTLASLFLVLIDKLAPL